MNNIICLGETKAGNPCRARAGSSGYCPVHDPIKTAEREKERQVREAAEQAAQARCERLREAIDGIKATCKRKGWKAVVEHFDYETGRHASLEVSRLFSKGSSSSYETVAAMLDVTLTHKGNGLRIALHGTTFYSYGLKDLYATIELDLEQCLLWLEPARKPSQAAAPDPLQKLELLLRRFHRVAHQLTQRHDHRPTLMIENEYDAQDLLYALLLTLFDDVRPEDPVPNRAGKVSRLDFFLKQEKIMIEVKMTSSTLGDARIGEQLIVDIERYQARPDCQTLICFVYDPGHYLKNPRALDDLSRKHDKLTVHIIVYSP